MLRSNNALFMTMKKPKAHSLLTTALALFLSILSCGCIRTNIEPYGIAVNDGERINPVRRYALVPPEAPSISQGYKPGKVTQKADGSKQMEYHYAIDIIEKDGTPVLAAAAGTIIRSYYDPFYGNRVFISHPDSAEGKYMSGYSHLQNREVSVGMTVARGETIGYLGHTGLLSGGLPHLHFEIRKVSKQRGVAYQNMNPHLFWFDGEGVITCYDTNLIYAAQTFKTTYPVPCLHTK